MRGGLGTWPLRTFWWSILEMVHCQAFWILILWPLSFGFRKPYCKGKCFDIIISRKFWYIFPHLVPLWRDNIERWINKEDGGRGYIRGYSEEYWGEGVNRGREGCWEWLGAVILLSHMPWLSLLRFIIEPEFEQGVLRLLAPPTPNTGSQIYTALEKTAMCYMILFPSLSFFPLFLLSLLPFLLGGGGQGLYPAMHNYHALRFDYVKWVMWLPTIRWRSWC